MAVKKNSTGKKSEWKGYHKITLTDEQDVEFDVWYGKNKPDFAWIEALANDGYKVSFNFDDYHTGVSCSLYCTKQKMDWAGYSLTSWGADAQEAFGMVCYKHYVVSNQQWEVVPYKSEKSYKTRG